MRPRFSEQQIEDALRKTGGIQTAAAMVLEQATGVPCSRQLIYENVRRSPRLRAVCEEALEEILDLGEGQLIAGVRNGDASLIKFLLETRGKNRGYTRRTEVTGADGTPVQVTAIEAKDARKLNIDLVEEVSQRLTSGIAGNATGNGASKDTKPSRSTGRD